MTTNLDFELSTIQTQIATAQAKKARAEVERENAHAALLSARTSLKEEFGVETNEEAKALLVSLSNELEGAVASVKESLTLSGVV